MQQISLEEAMRRALDLAEESKAIGNGPFGAVVLKDGFLVSESRNTTSDDVDPTAHAEVQAIRLACKQLNTLDLKGCILLTSCYPCSMCQSAAYWANIDAVYYSFGNKDTTPMGYDDSRIYKELQLPENEKRITFRTLLSVEGLQILDQ